MAKKETPVIAPTTTAEVGATRQPYLVAETPYDGARKVVFYEDTLKYHVPAARKTSAIRENIEGALTRPDAVVRGTTNPGFVAFVNSTTVSSASGTPFVVFVDPEAAPMPAVATAGHRRDFKDLSRHDVLWVPTEPTEPDDGSDNGEG